MELYNVDQKPLRKKDKEAYYYDDKGNFSKVPSMLDSKDEVFAFLMTCVKITFPQVTDDIIEEVWQEAEGKKAIIIDALDQLKREHESAADYFKSAAYKKAIPQIKSLQVPLLSGAQAQKIKGIGKGIASHIDEILKAGKLKSVEEREENRIKRQAVIELFTKIWGVNSKVAGEWYGLGFREITDLSEAKLSKQQQIGIKYYDEIKQLIPRQEVAEIGTAISSKLEGNHGVTNVDIVGPYRRGASEIDVVEIVVAVDNEKLGKALLKKIMTELEDIVTDYPVISSKKVMGLALAPEGATHRRIDITFVPIDERGAFLIHAIGPQAFVVHIKEMASQNGFKLKEDGLFKLDITIDGEDEKISVPDEEDVFDTFGMPYVDPEDRF